MTNRPKMELTKSELFAHVHGICKMKNTAYYGGYQKTFAHFLRNAYATGLCKSWNV